MEKPGRLLIVPFKRAGALQVVAPTTVSASAVSFVVIAEACSFNVERIVRTELIDLTFDGYAGA